MDDEKLIELVRVHPAIYDLSHRKYMDNHFKATIWNNIGLELGVSGLICKSRWSNIRDNFRKNIQKNVTKSGQGRKSTKPYKYHEQLSFLVKFFDDRNNIENVNDEDVTTQNDESNIPESSLPTQAISPAPEPYPIDSLIFSPTPSPVSQHTHTSLTNRYGSSLSSRSRGSRGRKENNKDCVRTASSEVMDYLIRQNEHPVDIFLASLAPTLKELHPCDLFDAKSEMFAIVQKYESKLLRNKFPRRAYESSTITSQNRSNVTNLETVVLEDHGSAITSQDRSNAINYDTVVVEDRGSAITSQGRSNAINYETVVVEDHGSVITSQGRPNAINYETVVVEDRGSAITSQGKSNAINYETVVVEDRGSVITSQGRSNAINYETVMDNNLDNRVVLVKDSNNKYTIKGFYNSFKQT
ncbi:hypothetical protein PYW08_003007 [Mythimna loreyi]|uniref:Uncharacterized protein n=1 Tax=Mythimna loreyi TaxID=667449 RepID=A0ACC2QQ60_9NEOP|nr:hypothetical protein PYW08_003007 [Mythimna loreyi]